MYRRQLAPSVLFCAGAAVAIASGACNRSQNANRVPEVQTQTAQSANQPMTVTGCLKAGEAPGMFLLTVAQTTGSDETATYQLVGPQVGNMQDHVGRRIEVSGTMEAQQEIATNAAPQRAGRERPTGTSGTPTVQTRTEIDIKRLSVSSIKPLDEKCKM